MQLTNTKVKIRDVKRVQDIVDGTQKEDESTMGGKIVLLTGSSQRKRNEVAKMAGTGRPVLHISLRDAVSPHTFLATLMEQLYEPLGTLGKVYLGLGFFWLRLHDAVSSPRQVREVNMYTLLSSPS